MSRGKLTPEIQAAALQHLGRDIDTAELRLMPYAHHVMLNSQKLDPAKLSLQERVILTRWRDEGHITGGASGMAITKEFYSALNEILWLGYVAHEELSA